MAGHDEDDLQRAADAVRQADALIIGAGAGMGVDSGLPDFRGDQGFWKAYPPYAKLGLGFSSLANPCWFRDDPELAWGFYGHRLNLYRATVPHQGFGLLRAWAGRTRHGAFVVTSNVDGQFQRAGFPESRIVEIHGSIDFMQCTRDCGVGLFSAGPFSIRVDLETMNAEPPLPACPRCGALARPNILMFGDGDFDDNRTNVQSARFNEWLRGFGDARVAILECGAGTAIPSIRYRSEDLSRRLRAPLIRINPREPAVPSGQIGLPLGALEGLRAIDDRLPSSP
jgi:NAD-dependent SIR2 family protein deacetylase